MRAGRGSRAQAERRDGAETQQAQNVAAQSEQEKAALRDRLREQLNVILETRETARGLIVNLSDVLFDTGSANLKPGAREKLARVSGILVSHPGLQLEVEGHTDSVGSDDYNQQLSERRAESVRAYLVRAADRAGRRRHRRLRRKPAGRDQRHRRRTPAESTRRARRLRRHHRQTLTVTPLRPTGRTRRGPSSSSVPFPASHAAHPCRPRVGRVFVWRRRAHRVLCRHLQP